MLKKIIIKVINKKNNGFKKNQKFEQSILLEIINYLNLNISFNINNFKIQNIFGC